MFRAAHPCAAFLVRAIRPAVPGRRRLAGWTALTFYIAGYQGNLSVYFEIYELFFQFRLEIFCYLFRLAGHGTQLGEHGNIRDIGFLVE